MSKEVKRYDPFGYDGLSALMHEDVLGDYVRHEDYDALLEENKRLESAWKVDVLNRKDELIAKQEKENDRVKAERDALLAERDAMAKDSERYRWLRQRLVGASFDWDDEGMTVLVFEMPDGVSIGADCDKNIDAALQGAQP